MNFEQSKGGYWLVISKFMGSYNMCQSLDIHIFHDKKTNRR